MKLQPSLIHTAAASRTGYGMEGLTWREAIRTYLCIVTGVAALAFFQSAHWLPALF